MAKRKSNKDKKLDPMVEFVVKEFEGYESFLSDRFKDAETIYKNWISKPEFKGEDWENRVHVPMTLDAEQTITPRLFSALFPNEAPIEVIVDENKRHESSQLIKGLLKKKFREAGVHGQAYPAVSQCTLLGTGYMSMGLWETKLVEIPIKNPETGKDDYQRKLVYSRPKAEHIDFFEMYPHPKKTRVNDGLPLIRKHYIDAEELRRMGKRAQAKNVDNALNSEIGDISGLVLPQGLSKLTGKVYEVLQFWGPYSADHDAEKLGPTEGLPYWIVVINREHLLWGIRNPYRHQREPYCKITLFPDIKPSWFGVGVGQVGLSGQERINKIVNQRLNNVDLSLSKQGLYNGNDPLINKDKLRKMQPNQFHAVSDVLTSVKFMDVPDVTASSYEEEKIAKEDFRQATGASAALAPAAKSEQHRTAMGINMLQGAAGQRFRPILKQMELDLVRDGCLLFMSNLAQFMPTAEWVSVTSNNGKEQQFLVQPEQIANLNTDFLPTGVSEMQEKEALAGQLLRFKELTVNDPTVNRVEINRRIAELMGFKDIEALLTNIEEPKNGGPMTANEQLMVQQMIQEGADPATIKARILGGVPR